GINDEGPPCRAGDVLNEGADVGALHIQGLAGLRNCQGQGGRGRQRRLNGQNRGHGGGQKGAGSHQRPVLTVVVCSTPFRSKRISALVLLESWPRRPAMRAGLSSACPLTLRMTSPDFRP